MKNSGLTRANPIKMDRKKTDVFWLMFFVFMVVVMIGVCVFGLIKGEMRQMTSPYDAAGNLCGYNNDEIKTYYSWSAA